MRVLYRFVIEAGLIYNLTEDRDIHAEMAEFMAVA